MKNLKIYLKDFLAEESGQDVVEYSLLLTLIGVMSISVLTMVGINITHLFNKTMARIQFVDAAVDITKIEQRP
jgi:Flp pilus assembly pilin Flp